MRKIFYPVIALLTGALSFGAIKAYSNDSLILNKGDSTQIVKSKPQIVRPLHGSHSSHASHASHASHFSQMVSIYSDTISQKSLNKKQKELFADSINNNVNGNPFKDIQIKQCYIVRKCSINNNLKGNKVLIELPSEALCLLINFSCSNLDVNVTSRSEYNFLLPLDKSINCAYIFDKFSNFVTVDKSDWMIQFIDSL